MGKQFSEDLKLKAVNYYNQINNYVQTCEIFGCSERSLKWWVDRFNETGTIERKEREQGAYKLTKDHIKFIKSTIKENNNIHMSELHKKVKDKFKDLDISRQYLFDILRDNNITRKHATFQHFPKTYRGFLRDEKEELKAFFKVIEKYKLNNIICLDETSASPSLSFNYCREKLGERCIRKTDDNAVFKKYSLLVAINNQKCMGYELYQEGAVNAERFNDFLKNLLLNVKNKLIILDNGEIHKKEETRKIIKDSGNFLLYTLPYHPRLNTIENWFNQLKFYMKLDKPMSFNQIKESIKNSIKKIKKEHYENYFIYAYNKDYYKNKKSSKKLLKHRKSKIYKD